MKEDYFVIFNSVTIATSVKKILEKRGITSILMHTPKSLQLNGCSYSLKIKGNRCDDVIDAAVMADARIIAVYKSTPEGYEEVKMT